MEKQIDLRAALTAPVMPVVNATPSVALSLTPPASPTLPSAASTSRAPLVLSFVIVLLVVAGLSAAVVFMMVDRRDARPAGKAENGARATAGDEEGAGHPSNKKVGKYSVVLESVMALDDDLSQAQIMEVLDAHIDEVKECYRKAIEREPGLKGGTLGVLLTANAAGKVTESELAQDTVGDTPMQLCITAKASAWKFPKSSTGSMGDTFTATWRFKR